MAFRRNKLKRAINGVHWMLIRNTVNCAYISHPVSAKRGCIKRLAVLTGVSRVMGGWMNRH